MKNYFVVALLVVTLAVPALADGPETGVVAGLVTDAQGQPLPGVTVTIAGDRGTNAVISDSDGSYRFALLTPGSYKVTAELEGFQAASSSINVTAGGKQDLTLEMRLTTSETITVTSEAPMVDKFNVTAGATVTSELGQQAAGENRTYYGVVQMLPGVTNDSDNADIQGTRPTVNGAHFADSSVFIDGVDTTFARFGGSRVFVPTTATTEISMEAGGASAEYGRVVGSATNVIVKSGTNSFHGQFAGTYEDTDWSSDYQNQSALTERQFTPKPPGYLKRFDEEWQTSSSGLEASIGGPLARDKAWFFVAYGEINTDDIDKTLNQDLVDTSFEFGSRIAKLNLQPGAAHQLALTYIDTPSTRIYFHPPSGDQYTPTPHDLSGEMASVNWNWSISGAVFLETKLATQTSNEDKFLAVGTTDLDEAVAIKQQDPRFPGNPAGGRHWPGNNYSVYIDSADSGSWHNGWLLDNGFGLNQYPRDQANAAMTWFAGQNHELKFGLDWQQVAWDSNVRDPGLYSGPGFDALSRSGYTPSLINPADFCGVTPSSIVPGSEACLWRDANPPDLVVQGNLSSSDNQNLALYARDRFTSGDHWVFNLGLRGEKQVNKNDVGREVVDTFTLAPRFMGSYDIKGDGKQLVSLNFGRYYAQLNQQFTNQWLQEEWNGYTGFDDYLWCSGTDFFITAFLNPGAIPGCEKGPGYNFKWRSFRPGEMWDLVDRDVISNEIEPYYKDEIILGFEWQVSRNWAIDVKAISWELGNMIGNTSQVQDVNDCDSCSLGGATTDYFFLSANYKNYKRILTELGVLDQSIIDKFQEGKKEYQALQFQFNRRFANGFAVYNNLTLADSETTGSGAWWNNTNSDYGEDLGTVLTQTMIDICQRAQVGLGSDGQPTGNGPRTVPVNCQTALEPWLGFPVSQVNRLGADGIQSATEGGSGADRTFVWKTFGYKQWSLGRHNLNLGGTFIYQDGTPWGRTETVSVPGFNSVNSAVTIYVEPNGTRRMDATHLLNLSMAWDFPLGSTVRGGFRIEGTNVTDAQDQVQVNGRGEVTTVRRSFQRPRKFRALASISF